MQRPHITLLAFRWVIPAPTADWLLCLVGAAVTVAVTIAAMTIVPGGRRTFTDALRLFRRRQA